MPDIRRKHSQLGLLLSHNFVTVDAVELCTAHTTNLTNELLYRCACDNIRHINYMPNIITRAPLGYRAKKYNGHVKFQ